MRIRLAIIAAVITFLLWPVSQALAHAILVRSDPEAGAVLVTAPQAIRLEFSEDLDIHFSKARLVDSNSRIITQGPGTIDAAAPRVLTLAIPALPNGSYSIIWQARSAVDGHVTDGSVGFSVGNSTARVSLLPPPGAPNPATALPSPLETILRWLSYLAVSLSVGSLLFGLLVWRPAYRSWKTPSLPDDRQAAQCIQQLAVGGSISLFVASMAFLVSQAWQSSQGAFQIPFGIALIQLLDPRTAGLFWARLIILGFVIYLARRLPDPGAGSSALWWGVTVLAGGLLLTFSLQGHGAALGSLLAVVIDLIHIAAMAAWLGGLLPLFLVMRSTNLPASLLIPRFSRVALVSVASLVLTGLYNAYVQVGTLEGLTATTYGRALLFKSAIFSILIGLGALNLVGFSPGLADAGGKAARHIRTIVRIELALGGLVLLAAGLLMGVSPGREALQALRRQGYVGAYQENGYRMALWLAPARAGDNEIAVDIRANTQPDSEGKPEVLLRFQMLDHDMGVSQVEAATQDGTRYTARGSYLAMAGRWQVEIILRHPGYNDIRHAFNIQVQANPQESTLPNPVPADAASIAAGQALYQENCLPCHGPKGKGDGPAGLALNPHPADLTLHAIPGVHTDGQLYEWITNGYPGSAMPAFQRKLTDEQRWSLVNFIRTLAPQKSATNQ